MPRQQTLRATVEWSYSLLNSSEQSLLRLLSVFAESFDLEAAEEVCCLQDIEEFDVDDLLGSLVDKSLVVAEPSGGKARYRLLETIRQFAAERLVESDEVAADAVGVAHASYYLSLAELAAPHLFGPEQGRWFARLDADQANLQRAMQHSTAERDGTERVLRFGVALQRYWRVRGRDEEAVSLLTSVLERPEAQADPSCSPPPWALSRISPATPEPHCWPVSGRSRSLASSMTTDCSSGRLAISAVSVTSAATLREGCH